MAVRFLQRGAKTELVVLKRKSVNMCNQHAVGRMLGLGGQHVHREILTDRFRGPVDEHVLHDAKRIERVVGRQEDQTPPFLRRLGHPQA